MHAISKHFRKRQLNPTSNCEAIGTVSCILGECEVFLSFLLSFLLIPASSVSYSPCYLM